MNRTAKINQLLDTAAALLEEARRLSSPTLPTRQAPKRVNPPQWERATDEEVAKCFSELRALLAAQ